MLWTWKKLVSSVHYNILYSGYFIQILYCIIYIILYRYYILYQAYIFILPSFPWKIIRCRWCNQLSTNIIVLNETWNTETVWWKNSCYMKIVQVCKRIDHINLFIKWHYITVYDILNDEIRNTVPSFFKLGGFFLERKSQLMGELPWTSRYTSSDKFA